MNETELWAAVLDDMQQRIPSPSYETWFKPTNVKGFVDDQLVVETTNEFQRDWLQSRYQEQVDNVIIELTNQSITAVTFVTGDVPKKESITGHTRTQDGGRYDELLNMIFKLNDRVFKLETEIEKLKAKGNEDT